MTAKKTSKKKRVAPKKKKVAKPASPANAAKKARAAGNDPKRVATILAKLDEAYPNALCELKHQNPFQLLDQPWKSFAATSAALR